MIIANSSIKQKVWIALGCLLAVIFFAVAGNIWSMRVTKRILTESEENGKIEKSILKLQADVNRLLFLSTEFVRTGYQSYNEGFLSLSEDLKQQLATLESRLDKSNASFRLTKMRHHFLQFLETQKRLVEDRRFRAVLAKEKIPSEILKLRKKLSTHSHDLFANGNLNLLFEIENKISSLEIAILKFYESPRSSKIVKFNTLISDLRAQLEKLPIEKAPKLKTDLINLEKLFLLSVQVTRSYSYFLNVVMAGQSSEFRYQASKLRDDILNQSELVSQAIHSDIEHLKTWLIFLGGMGIVLALIMMKFFNQFLLLPLGNITQTFRELAKGEVVDDIPGVSRTDEIGELATAADVFKKKNEETGELLKQTSTLASNLKIKNEELDKFAYVASHDLKSPLRNISQLATWVVEDCAGILPDESKKHLDMLKNRVKKMERLLSDLLTYSRVGNIKSDEEEISVRDLISEIIEFVDNPKNIKFNLPDSAQKLTVNKVAFEQVLRNLIENSIKYNDKESEGVIDFLCQQNADKMIFTVKDNGPGIAPEHHTRIFEMYQRLTLDEDVDGSGMGLAIVKKHCEKWNGSIEVDSDGRSGCSFNITIPQKNII